MRTYQALLIGAAMLVAASPANAFCMIVDKTYAKEGWTSGAPRQMTVADEYRMSDYVLTGKVIGLRRLEQHDGGFEATNYRVALVTLYKGKPPKTLTIYSSNTTARFDMDVGKTYILFLHPEGKDYWVDNCGWSDEVSASKPVLNELEHRAEFSKRPLHCWKNTKMRGCVPDLRTNLGGVKPEHPL